MQASITRRALCVIAAALIAVSAAAGFLYRDSLAGAQITIPDGWREEPTDLSSAKTSFISEDGVAFVLYRSRDMLEFLPLETDLDKARLISDTAIVSPETFALAVGVSKEDVTLETIGDLNFYSARYSRSLGTDDGTFSVKYASFLHIKNGYQFIFTFGIPGSAAESAYHDDLYEMLGSLKLPEYKSASGGLAFEFILITALFVLLIICLILYFKQKARQKRHCEEAEIIDNQEYPDA